MELQERLSYLENFRDWQGVVEELEKAISATSANTAKAALHLRLGRLLESKFLSGVKALKHFQDAYKLNPALIESLEAARFVYWDLGKLNMVQKLLELELKSVTEGMPASERLVELGDVLSDAGDYERAASAYARALAASGGKNPNASASLEDVQLDAATWKSHVTNLVLGAAEAHSPDAKGRAFLRAARVAKRFAPDEVEVLLGKAYASDPRSRQVAALYEGFLSDKGMLDALEAVQSEVLTSIDDKKERAQIAHVFGNRWVARHQNGDIGTKFLELAVKLDPESEGAFAFLREMVGRKAGDWDRVIAIAEEAASRSSGNGSATFHLAQAGVIAWRHVGNLIRARQAFERLCAVAPEHPQLRAFEAQIGETLVPRSGAWSPEPPTGSPPRVDLRAVAQSAPPPNRTSTRPTSLPSDLPTAPPPSERTLRAMVSGSGVVDETPQPVSVGDRRKTTETSLHDDARAAVEATQAQLRAEEPVTARQEPEEERPTALPSEPPPPPVVEAAPVEAAPPPVVEAAPPPPPAAVAAAADGGAPPTASDEQKIAELRALAEKQEGAKRFNEFVKTLLQLAALVYDNDEKVRLYMRAADLYITKFANQAEAVKAFEAVVAIEPDNATAIDYLRQMYEKRRDWEKLLGLQRREAERLEPGPERAARFLDIAKMATERVKKPEVCIDLWQEVLASDESNAEALGALAGLYERSKEFTQLAGVLERQAEVTYDDGAKIQILSKLGTIYGDRLNDDEGAVRAWGALLALDPQDRKAQEALKKKYLALGKWDELEVFYAESGKWDELIRVLEQQETKETVTESKIGLLFKIAQLWADKKQKSDRAAKAYEKILELEPKNLRAAEALVPLYKQAGNQKALANVLEVKLGHEEDAYEQARSILREVARPL